MASTAVQQPPPPSSDHHLIATSLPLIDLRHLTQSELNFLSLSSSSAVDHRRSSSDAAAVIPTIDRAVFNESSGSHRQTFSRLRLAARKSAIQPNSHADVIGTEDDRRIVSILKELIVLDAHGKGFDSLVSVPVQYGDSVPKSSSAVLQTVAVDVSVGMKRKRGRKPKNEMAMVVYDSNNNNNSNNAIRVNSEELDKEIVNKNGVVVDISALAATEDPYGDELRRRTEGMETDGELLEFLNGLVGQWGSTRKKRRIVEASDFGGALPNGWKLLLSLKKKAGRVWLFCRRYISPSGRNFISCKEISSYLLSLSGPKDASMLVKYDVNNQTAAPTLIENKKRDDITCTKRTTIASSSTDHEFPLLRNHNPGETQVNRAFNCTKCIMSFDEKDDFFEHLLSSHKKIGRGGKLGTSVSDGVIIKDGIFECQFCHKTFLERHRYNGHVGNHVKDYVKNLKASSEVVTMPMNIDPVAIDGVLPIATAMQITISSNADSITKPCNVRANFSGSGSPLSELQEGSTVKTCIKEHTHEYNQEHSMNVASTSWMEEPKQDIESERGSSIPNINEKSCNAEKIADTHPCNISEELKIDDYIPNVNEKSCNVEKIVDTNPCNTSEELKIDDYGQFENSDPSIALGSSGTAPDEQVACEYKQQESSDGFSFGSLTQEKDDDVNDMEGGLTFGLAKSKEESGSEGSLLLTSCDKQACGLKNNVDKVCASLFDESNCVEVDNSEIKAIPINFGINDARPDVDIVTGPEQDRTFESSSPHISGINDPRASFVENVGIGAPHSTTEKTKLAPIENFEKSGLIMSLDSNQNGRGVQFMPNFEQRKGSEDCSFGLPGNVQRFGAENNFIKSCNNSMGRINQGRVSENCFINPSRNEQNRGNKGINVLNSLRENSKSDEVRNSWSGGLFIGLGSSHAGPDVDVNRNFEGRSIGFSGNVHPFGAENNVTNIYNNVVHVPKQNSNVFGQFRGDQSFAVENNSKQFYSGTGWPVHKLGTAESSRNNDLMIDFSNSLARPVEDAVVANLWRNDEQNIMQCGLPDATLPMVQSSSCFTGFDFISDKSENDLFSSSEQFDNIPGFEGMQSNVIEQTEYNFFTQQTNSFGEDSKSYDVEMEQAFDSSLWLGNASLSSKTAIRNHFSVLCAWCGNEFQHEAFDSGPQTGSIGYICPTCKTKISGQFNVM